MEKSRNRVDIWSIFIYLILYSMAGFIIETVFGAVTKGVIESRKSFLYGPFCAIYGIGAVSMILLLKNQKSLWKIFFGGAIIGAIVEYGMSFFCEIFFCVKWWDYSGELLNIHGRTCLFYAASWGLLAIFLIKFVNPYVDIFIDILKQKKKIFKTATFMLFILFSANALVTSYALKVFYYRISTENNLDISNKTSIQEKYAKIQNSDNFDGFINQYYDNEKMIKTYPNIMIEEKNDNTVSVESLLKDITPYYFRIGRI